MEEIKKKIKEEQNRVREEVSIFLLLQKKVFLRFLAFIVHFQRHKEYVKMLKEREEALGEF